MAVQRLRPLLLLLALSAVRASTWTRAPLLPVLMAASQNISGEQCRQDYRFFLDQLGNNTLWAVEMFDASTKVPEGLLAGNVFHLGHFDQCTGISVNLGERYIKGQYCIADINFQQSEGPEQSCDDELQPEDSAWKKLQWCGNPSKIRRNRVHWALCVPSSCSPEDVHMALSESLVGLGPSLGVTFNVSIPPEQCSMAEEGRQLGTSAVVLGCVAIIFVFLFLTSTVFDFICCGGSSEKEILPGGEAVECSKYFPAQKYFLVFSARRNIPKLTTLVPCQPAFDFSHGIRFLFMALVITGHRAFLYFDQPFLNPEKYEAMFHAIGDMMLANGAAVVDIYFMLSGVLLGYLFIGKFKENGTTSIFYAVANFFVRILPVYMLIVWFNASVLSHIGSGPFWKAAVYKEERRCLKNWWANFILIQNYWDPQNMCIFTSWYLAVHFHMFIFCLLLTTLLLYRPRLGWIMFGLAIILSVLIPFFNIWWYKVDPIIKPYPDFGPDVRNNKVFHMVYVKSHNRAAPYLVGTVTGILLFRARKSSFQLSKITSYIIFYGGWALGITVILSCYVFFIPDRPYSAVDSGLYGSLHHLFMALAAVVVFISMTFGDMRAYRRIFSSPVFVVLSRLSFNAYLMHSTLQLYDQGALRVPRYLSFYVIVWDIVGDVTITYFLALLMALIVEIPLRDMFKMLTSRNNNKKEEL